MFVDGPGDDDGFVVRLPDSMGRGRTARASGFYGCAVPDLETLAEQSGARDRQACGHTEASRRPDGSCGACAYTAWLASARIDAARQLGRAHGSERRVPYGDLDDAGSGDLMTALGEHGWTAEENYPRRVAMLEAYREGWEAAAGRSYPVQLREPSAQQ